VFLGDMRPQPGDVGLGGALRRRPRGARLQQGARLAETNDLAPFAPKLEAFGWHVEEINGHNHAEICRAVSRETTAPGKPKCIVAHTNKGHGISFMSDNVAWHHKVPNEEQYRTAMAELMEAEA